MVCGERRLGFSDEMTGGSNVVNKISLPLWLIFVVVHDRHRGNAIGSETTAESVFFFH